MEHAQRKQHRAERGGTHLRGGEAEVRHQGQPPDRGVDHVGQDEARNDLPVLLLDDLHDRLRSARRTKTQIQVNPMLPLA